MKRSTSTKLMALSLCASLGLVAPQAALAEDIDIFTGASAGSTINPRILIVLDNTSNWSRQNQQWPGGKAQGQSEADAIRTAIADLDGSVSVGLMEFVTGGNANDDGGFIRSEVKPMSPANANAFGAILGTISANINSPDEKRNSGTPYGNLMYDVYNYFTGSDSYSPSATLASKADTGGYTNAFTRFKSPLTSDNTCGRSFVIFIGNPNASGPSADNAANTARLNALNDNRAADNSVIPVTQLGLPNFSTQTVVTPTDIGVTSACYASSAAAAAELNSFAATCANYTDGCKIGTVTANDGAAACAAGSSKYTVVGTNTVINNVETGTTSTDTKPYNADEWARMMHDRGIPVAGTTIRPSVTTYTIDVYNKQPNASHTSLLMSMAKAGGGRYFVAKNEQAITDALKEIMVEIQAVNSTFASTSLPVNATNRSQNVNQVFIGMFRPDPVAKPRWFGNLKRYQLVSQGASIELADVGGKVAVNPLTGFVTPCATSYWTRDSANYWANKGLSPDPAGGCTVTAFNKYSDAPDGPLVEKGAAAQVLREGNTGGTVTNAVNRTMLTVKDGAFVPFTAANSGLDSDLVKYISGEDVNNERNDPQASSRTRPSIHGDVIHSRPLPVNYGSGGVTVYYGANDGTLRALNAENGTERWAFVAPEFFSRLSRIENNSPRVSYPGINAADFTPAPKPKDYFYDGSIGVYQTADNARVWIYPSMRRGGRMLYGIDVTNPATPVLKWRAGCPNLLNDTGCTEGMSGIGQTWSTPSVAFIKGNSTTTPVVVVGGGYDKCEDTDSATPSCSGAKGGFVYVLDGATGALLRSFATDRSVAADVAMVDIDNDTYPDYAYAADTGGNVYRIDFIASSATRTARTAAEWTSRKVAYTGGAGRKFLFAPALLYSDDKVYLAIGSGDREHPLEAHYPFANVVNRFYVYRDNLSASPTSLAVNMDGMADYTRSDSCGTAQVLPDSSLNGWFMDLNQYGQGEQVVTTGLIAGGMVTFSTNRPVPAPLGSCSTALGQARGYWVNLLNGAGAIDVPGTCGGKRSSVFVGGGLPPSPVFASSVQVGGKSVSVVIGAAQKGGDGAAGASVAISPQRIRPTISSKRKRAYTYTKGE
ncbi:pilus assembly protein [Massilia cavernae]|uniref:PilY1 beta-propeller domain-containing protein n=1 Tax=Massilia cavernae TaxID=2320864 RepID=A0A418XQB5_9BURK|nr:PilC/PilY family type IV pilus protein [Massilia cavernae]RJG14670.1 hypothetical protein D3872_17025 [Massilia cavernae]